MRLLIKACLLLAVLLHSHAQATGPSGALLLPQGNEWQRALVPVFPARVPGPLKEAVAPFVEQLEVGMPGKGRVAGKVVFDRPVDFEKQTLNLYFDLDNNRLTGRAEGVHRGVDVMLGVRNKRANVVLYDPDGTPSPGHVRLHEDGTVLWFTFQVPESMEIATARAYAVSQQQGVRNDNTNIAQTFRAVDGGLVIEPLFRLPSFDFAAPSADNVPEAIREMLALAPDEGEARVLYEDRMNGSTTASSPLVQRVSAMHLGDSRLFFQIDIDRDLAGTGEQLILYLDTDKNAETGRSDATHKGIDLMVVIGNNGTIVSSRSNDLNPEYIKARARQDGRSIYLVLDIPQMKLDRNDAVAMSGYVASQGKSKRGSQTRRLGFDLPVQKKPVPALPKVKSDVLNPAGYRYLQNNVAYESLQNKGNLRSEISLSGYKPVRQAPLPEFIRTVSEGGQESGITPQRVVVTVEEDAGVTRTDAVVRFGFPLPRGKIFSVADVAVTSEDGSVLPAQVQATALWSDGSFRWLVIQVRDDISASEAKRYGVVLEKDAALRAPEAVGVEVVEDSGRLLVFTGALRTAIDVVSFRGVDFVEIFESDEWKPVARAQDGFVIVDEQGESYSTAKAKPRSVSFEEQTPERVTIRVAGDYASTDGKPYMSYVCRLTFYAGSARVDMSFTHINSRLDSEFSDFRSLDYALALDSPVELVQVLTFGGSGAPLITEAETVLIRQMTDADAEMLLDGVAESAAYRLPGALRLQTKDGLSLALAVTDFWQRWPKGIHAEGERLQLELLPVQPDAGFGSDLPYYLMYPFVEGFYRLKWGMAFTERVSLDFAGKSGAAALWAEAQQPLVAVVPAEWYVQTQALIPLAEPDGNQFSLWDEYIGSSLEAHLKLKDAQREYGFLNYGDWFGERGRNWGNNEYDLPHTLFSQFARTGERRFYRAALSGVRHQADSDIVHAYPDPYYIGANHEHSIGHTGQWSSSFPNSTWSYVYDFHTAAGNGHTWADGMIDAWVLGADPVVMEAALKLGDHITYAFAPGFTGLGTHERSAGWSMRALMAMFRGTGDPVYLGAADRIGQTALSAQDREKTGVWPHELPRDHADGRVGIYGNNSFLMGVLVNGLAAYHTETGDPDYAQAIAHAGGWLKDGWDGQTGGWPYSIAVDGSAVGRSRPELNPLIYSALLYGALVAEDAEGIAYAEDAMTATFSASRGEAIGKDISLKGFFTPESLGLLQRYYRGQEQAGGSDAKNVLSSEPEARQKYFQQISVTDDFAVRTPELKEFLVESQGPANVMLSRRRFGSVSKSHPAGSITVVGDDGSVVLEQSFGTAESNSFSVEIPAAGQWRILIDDERNAVWNAASEQARVSSLLLPGYSIGGVARKRMYFDVPEGTQSFTLRVIGIHQGNYGAAVLNPEGVVRADVTGDNRTIHLLGDGIDFDDAAHRSAVADIVIDVTAADNTANGPWSLILWAQGDIGVQLSGIPPYVFID